MRLLALGAFALICTIGCQPTLEIVIPEGFEGPVVVVFNDPAGIDARGDLAIPNHGNLFVKERFRRSFFEVYQETEASRNRLSCTRGNSSDPKCSGFLIIAGNLNGCLPDTAPQFKLITFVVSSDPNARDWGPVQEQAVREATLESLDRRGQKDVIKCYREHPHRLGSYLRYSS